MSDLEREYREALRDYKLARQQENNASAEYIEIAIMNTNAARKKVSVLYNALKSSMDGTSS